MSLMWKVQIHVIAKITIIYTIEFFCLELIFSIGRAHSRLLNIFNMFLWCLPFKIETLFWIFIDKKNKFLLANWVKVFFHQNNFFLDFQSSRNTSAVIDFIYLFLSSFRLKWLFILKQILPDIEIGNYQYLPHSF